MKTTTTSWRELARQVIAPIVLASAGLPRREIRRKLRRAYQTYHLIRDGYPYKVWCEEVAFALRDRSRRFTRRTPVLRPADVMPAMREWAARRGLMETLAVLDVDDAPKPRGGGGEPTT